MARGENTADHPGRKVHRESFDPNAEAQIRQPDGSFKTVSAQEYDTWRAQRKAKQERHGILGGD
jgi:hypothetical protein